MQKIILGIFCILTAVQAQSEGNGISKFTRGASDPRSCLKFFKAVLAGTDEIDGCTDGKCECATQGRAAICSGSQGRKSQLPEVAGPPGDSHFGLHSINCTFHPYGEHDLKDIEDMVSAEVNDFKDGMSQHADSHMGAWSSDLKTQITALEAGSYSFTRMSFESAGATYYSVVAQACGGYFVEVISDKATDQDPTKFKKVDEPRFDFTDFKKPTEELWVIKLSRATSKIDEMIDFYTNVIEGKVLKQQTLADGTKWAQIKLTSADAVIHLVNRPAAAGAKFTVKDLEDYVNSVHDKYVKSTNCGFDQFADHHWAYDQHSSTETLSSVSKKLEAGGHKYRYFSLPGDMHQIYSFDPSGWTFQLDFAPGDDVPSKSASYSAACKSDDGCYGQGLCDDVKDSKFFRYDLPSQTFLM